MKNNRIIFLFSFLILLVLLPDFAFSQNPNLSAKPKYNRKQFRELFTQGNMMMMENFNDTALNTFLLLHKWDPTNANVNFKIGQLYLLSSSEKSKAVEYLESAAPKATRSYTPDDPSEKRCSELVYKLLGQAYHLTYRFDESIAMFEKFSTCINMSNLVAAEDIKHRIEISKTAKALINAPVKCTITNLGDSINSPYPDYGAVITADESQLYFTSRRFNSQTGGNDNRDIYDNFFEDIWGSYKKDDGTWSEAKPVSTHINSWYNEAVVGISTDGQQMLIYKDDNGGSILISHFAGEDWSYPYILGTESNDIADINTQYHEPSACLSPDGNTLYFVSNRPGGFGGEDIYKCVKLPTGRWSKSINLGSTINTQYDEDAPYMHPDGVTMFFSSNGHKTMGGFDIFFTQRTDSGWLPPQNMGYPINTTDDDIFYVMSPDGKHAYFSSVRPTGKGEKDIYMITIPQSVVTPITLLKGHITFNGRKDSLATFVTITATDMETGQVTQEVHPNSRTMKYVLPLNPGRTDITYSVRYEAVDYRPYTEIITVLADNQYKEINKNVDLKPPGTITVYGTILTRTKQPVTSVIITIKDNKSKKANILCKADENGAYSFDLSAKGGESYSITYTADGFISLLEILDLPEVIIDYDFRKDRVMEADKSKSTTLFAGKNMMDKNTNPRKGLGINDNSTKMLVTDSNQHDKKDTVVVEKEVVVDKLVETEKTVEKEVVINEPVETEKKAEKKVPLPLKAIIEIKKEAEKGVMLEKTHKEENIALNNIFFDFHKASLRQDSKPELDRIVNMLKDNPSIKIEISGHTDNISSAAYNLKLSRSRADAVVQYLITKGINHSRLIAHGYGEAQPIAPNMINGKPNAENMQMNRRVEFKILEK